MSLNKTGWLKNGFTQVSWSIECPIHAGVLNLSYPPASTSASTATEYAMEMIYCPSGTGALAGGHTFPYEMSNATVYSSTNNNTQTGTGLTSTASVLYSGVPAAQVLDWN